MQVEQTAQRIIEKCGGAKKTAILAEATENWVYRWTYPKERGGTGGRVPRDAMINLLRASAEGRCSVTAEDFLGDATAGQS